MTTSRINTRRPVRTPTHALTRGLAAAALAPVLLALVLASCSSPSLKREALAPRLAKLTTTSAATIRGEALLRPKAVAAFYEARKSEPAWSLPGDASSVRDAIARISEDGLDPSDYHLALIDTLLEERKHARTDELDTDLELALSDAVAGMVDHVRYGRVRPTSLNPRWNVDSREGAPPLEQSIARVAQASNPAAGVEQEKLTHFIYQGLKAELARLDDAAKAGGWPRVAVAGKSIAPGSRDARVPALRARLRATGELAANAGGSGADSLVYDDALQNAVKLFQERHRLDADAAVDGTTLEALNVPLEERVAQVRANLERARWVLPGLEGDFLLVNLPAFKAYLIRGGKNVWESRTVIGKEGRESPSFRDDMEHVIFNPTWTVPPTILAEDVLGGMRKGEDMIAKKQLRIFDENGNEVDKGSIDWSSATPENFHYTLRQDAGEDNALGRIKFMFPNPYNIYLHDTPSRELFEEETRTFSSGCIRLQDPRGLAQQLLGDQGYDPAKIQATIDAGATKTVNLTHKLPILIVYWTVSVGSSGEVRYAPDVYGLDPPLVRALDGPALSRSAALEPKRRRG